MKSADVKDDGLAGADIDEASLEGVDAATLDDLPEATSSSGRSPARRRAAKRAVFYSYDMVTPEAGTDYVIGQVKLRTTAVAQEFQVCGATGLADPVPTCSTSRAFAAEDSVGGLSLRYSRQLRRHLRLRGRPRAGARAWGSPTLNSADVCELLALQST